VAVVITYYCSIWLNGWVPKHICWYQYWYPVHANIPDQHLSGVPVFFFFFSAPKTICYFLDKKIGTWVFYILIVISIICENFPKISKISWIYTNQIFGNSWKIFPIFLPKKKKTSLVSLVGNIHKIIHNKATHHHVTVFPHLVESVDHP
jgi:hypothetical protein